MNKINAIYIQSYKGEIVNGQLAKFLQRFRDADKCTKDIYLFLDQQSEKCQQSEEYNDLFTAIKDLDITVVMVDTSGYRNEVTYMFYFMMNYKVGDYTNILLLEPDCHVRSGFDSTINSDLKDRPDFWIYGSTYYGNNRWARLSEYRRGHMNGIAVYHRSEKLLRFIENLFITNNRVNCVGNINNYDWVLYEAMYHEGKIGMTIDSKYVLNISMPDDVNIGFEHLKKEAMIIHTKSDTLIHL